LEGTGLGYQREIDMLCQARELDMLTIGYAFNEADTMELMTKAAPDIFIFHAGITRGGTTGYAGGSSLEEMAQRSQRHFEIAKSIHPDVILLAHGAALVNPADAEYLYQATDCHGVQLGSSIERLAIEEPLKERAALFKATTIRKKSNT
jgi:predicted TIM-barrel enzyme